MQNFLSTLAELTGTLLSIFLASLVAYFVFLQDRSAQFSERIEQAKLDIRDSLLQLRAKWPWTLTMYLPPEFKDSYRAKVPNTSQVDLTTRAAFDLFFEKSLVNKTLSEVDRDHLKGRTDGRIYFWILNECLTIITVGSPDARSKPEGVFPSSPYGLGYEQWRADFEQLRGVLQLLSDFQDPMIVDFDKYTTELPPEYVRSDFSAIYKDAVHGFFKTVDLIRARLDSIDKQEFSLKKYSFSQRVHLFTILVLSVLVVILGIIVPLILLTLPRELTPVVGLVLLVCTLSAVSGASYQFVRDVSRPVSFDLRSYLSARWYSLLLKEMDRQRSNFSNGGMVDSEFFLDALSSQDSKNFPANVLELLERYVDGTKVYNKKAQNFNDAFLAAIRADEVIGPVTATYKSPKGGPVLYPYYTLQDETQWRSHLQSLLDISDGDVAVEFLMPRWTRAALKIPGDLIKKDRAKVGASLEAVRALMRDKEIAREFGEAKSALEASAQRLRDSLIKASK